MSVNVHGQQGNRMHMLVVLGFVTATMVPDALACSLCDHDHDGKIRNVKPSNTNGNPPAPPWVCATSNVEHASGCPKPSDVPMRSLRPWYSPQPSDPSHGEGNGIGMYTTWEAAAAFKVNRMDWVYSSNASFVTDARAHGMRSVSFTINGNLPDTGTTGTYKNGRILDLYGRPITAPWMSTWKNPPMFGCINNPAYLAIIENATAEMLGAGVNAVQHDDPGTNGESCSFNRGDPTKSGCYCEFCMKKFADILTTTNILNDTVKKRLNISEDFSYKQYLLSKNGSKDATSQLLRDNFVTFQQNSTETYLANLRTYIHTIRPNVPLSCNNGGRWTTPYFMCDFGLGELALSNSNPAGLKEIFQTFVPKDRKQMMTMPKAANITTADIGVIRWAIATAYALGGNMLIPWDIYLPTPNAKRYYGNASFFVDILSFIQDNEIALDSAVAIENLDALNFTKEYTGHGGDGKRYRLPIDISPPSHGTCSHGQNFGSCENACVLDADCVAIFVNDARLCCVLYEPLHVISGTDESGTSYLRQHNNRPGFASNDTFVHVYPRKNATTITIHVVNYRDVDMGQTSWLSQTPLWSPPTRRATPPPTTPLTTTTMMTTTRTRSPMRGEMIEVNVFNSIINGDNNNNTDCPPHIQSTLLSPLGRTPTPLPYRCNTSTHTTTFTLPAPTPWSLIQIEMLQ